MTTQTLERTIPSSVPLASFLAVSTRPRDCMPSIRSIARENRCDHSPKACASKAHRIAAVLRAESPAAWLLEGSESFDSDLLEIIERLEAIQPHLYPGEHPDMPIDELHQLLAHLFDWAEAKSLFIGN